MHQERFGALTEGVMRESGPSGKITKRVGPKEEGHQEKCRALREVLRDGGEGTLKERCQEKVGTLEVGFPEIWGTEKGAQERLGTLRKDTRESELLSKELREVHRDSRSLEEH